MSLPVNKTTFVFLKRTRQVLATTTRLALPPNAIPTGSETPEQLAANTTAELKRLVGAGLPVRDLPAERDPAASLPFDVMASGILFPATELDVVTGDFKPTSVADPRMYFIDETNSAKLGLNPALTIAMARTQVSVTVTSSLAQDSTLLVWVFYDDKSKPPIPLEGTIKKDANPLKVDIPVVLTPGNYHALVLMQNVRPVIHAETVT